MRSIFHHLSELLGRAQGLVCIFERAEPADMEFFGSHELGHVAISSASGDLAVTPNWVELGVNGGASLPEGDSGDRSERPRWSI